MDTKPKLYLSGKIADNPTAETIFMEAHKRFSPIWDVVNPIIIGNQLSDELGRTPTYDEYLLHDINHLKNCDAIIMLKDWEYSPGARAEHAFAVAVRMKVIYD